MVNLGSTLLIFQDDDFAPIKLQDFDVFLNDTQNVVSRQQSQPKIPVFHNCVTSNLTINYYNQKQTNN